MLLGPYTARLGYFTRSLWPLVRPELREKRLSGLSARLGRSSAMAYKLPELIRDTPMVSGLSAYPTVVVGNRPTGIDDAQLILVLMWGGLCAEGKCLDLESN